MRTKLVKDEEYAVRDPFMCEWLVMKYMGYNKLEDKHIFVSKTDDEVLLMFETENVDGNVY